MHVITTLGPAGAETMLCRLASAMDRTRFENEIVSLTPILDLAKGMEASGVRVRTLGMKVAAPNPMLILRLAQWIRRSRPDIIHTWMYHANLVGGVAARLAGNVPVVWGIHHSVLDARTDKRRTFWVNRACAFLSRNLPSKIVCCSQASWRIHQDAGYSPQKLEVIPNGVDLEYLKPDSEARESVRRELGVSEDAFVIAMAARFHPYKDHRNFIQAAARLHRDFPKVHFLLFGLDITCQNSRLVEWIDVAGLRECCHLLGLRQDIPRLFAAADIATSASLSEAFPVAIVEAMACGTPCVVTDVGDSAAIVDRTGLVVKAGDPRSLSAAWRELIEAGADARSSLGMAARRRVQQNFGLPSIVERYQQIYSQLANSSPKVVPAPRLSQCAR